MKEIEGQLSLADWLETQGKTGAINQTSLPIPVPAVIVEKPKSEITDFGSKIGGAKKDLWASEHDTDLVAGDVKKTDIWPRPDWKMLKAEGVPVPLIYYEKAIYDAIPTVPKIPDSVDDWDRGRILDGYYDTVCALRNYVRKFFRTEDDVGSLADFLEDNGMIHLVRNRYSCRGGCEAFITSRLVNALMMNRRKAEYEVRKKRFLYTDEEKLLADYVFIKVQSDTTVEPMTAKPGYLKIGFRDGAGVTYYFYAYPQRYDEKAALPESYPAGSWFVAKGHTVFKTGFASQDAAREYILKYIPRPEKAAASQGSRKKSYQFAHLAEVRRTGGEDYRHGKDVSGEDYLRDFNFRGGEFGNWLGQNERQQVLNFGYDAFMDMAHVLKITPEQLTGNGKLAIAFGARGRGRALAHFEPDKCVINLTRMNGAGSLGHEMIHFLDYLIGRNLGFRSFLSQSARSSFETPVSFRKLMQAIKGTQDGSRFYRDAVALDALYAKSGNGYWFSDIELLAQAGAAWLKDRLEDEGIQNDYLCGHADSVVAKKDGREIFGSPQGKEREQINAAFDVFFAEMSERNII